MRRLPCNAKFAALAVLIFANPIWTQAPSIYRLPAGTRIRLKMDAEINSEVSSVDDTFLAYVAKPVMNRDVVVVPEGTVIEGRIIKVTRASAGNRDGGLEVTFETLRLKSGTRRIEGTVTSPFRVGSSSTFKVLSVLGGAAAGAVLGGLNSTTGALIGAGIGAGAGTGVALAHKGKELRLKRGEEFEIELKKEVVLPVLDY